MARLKAIIFDLFGTLIENFSDEEYRRVMAAMAATLAAPVDEFHAHSVATWAMRKTGVFGSTEANVEYICRMLELPAEAALIAVAAELRVDLTRRILLQPVPGAVETLTALRECGYKIGLISDCSAEVPLLWPTTELAALIDAPIFSCAVGLAKPEPGIYQRACDQLEVQATDCLYIGDGSGRELTGARQAGMRAVLLRVPFESTTDTDRPEIATWQGLSISSVSEVLALVE